MPTRSCCVHLQVQEALNALAQLSTTTPGPDVASEVDLVAGTLFYSYTDDEEEEEARLHPRAESSNPSTDGVCDLGMVCQ